MANKFKVEIQETVEELEHRLQRAITAVSKEKLLLLYWLATKKIKTREELARMLKRDESTLDLLQKSFLKVEFIVIDACNQVEA